MFRLVVLAALLAAVLIGCTERTSLVAGNDGPPPGLCTERTVGNFDEASRYAGYVLGAQQQMAYIRVDGIAHAAGDSLYVTTPVEDNAIEVRVIQTTTAQPRTQRLEFYLRVDSDMVMVRGNNQIVRKKIDTPGTIDVLTKDILE